MLLVPLTAALVEADFAAVCSASAYLQWWSDSSWPNSTFSLAENEADLIWHDDEHQRRIAFTYSVLDAVAAEADKTVVIGCVYIRPFESALATRGVGCPAELRDRGDAVARGWLVESWRQHHSLLAESVVTWLRSPAWGFPDAWWMERARADARVKAADHVVDGWILTQTPG
jgi:hypothetical protein